MQTLNNPKRTFTLTREALIYIEKYQRIYKRVLKKVNKRDIYRYVIEPVDRTKAIWRLINREICRASENVQKLELKIKNKIISNPTEIIGKLNTHFVSTEEELVRQKSN